MPVAASDAVPRAVLIQDEHLSRTEPSLQKRVASKRQTQKLLFVTKEQYGSFNLYSSVKFCNTLNNEA